MKKTLLLLALLLASTSVIADVETTDKLLISELTVEPGSSDTYSFTVSLQGSENYYTAYQVELYLPEGLNVVYSEEAPKVELTQPSLYPYTTTSMNIPGIGVIDVPVYTHTLSKSMISTNHLRVAVISTENKLFTATSGDLFKVYVQASPYLKPGDAGIKIEAKLVTKDETKHIPATYTSTSVKAGTTSTLNLKVSETNKFGTCILPFDYVLPTDGTLEAYTCNSYTEDKLILSKVESNMEAYTPYILYSETGFDATISGDVDASQYPAEGTVKQGCLVGTIVQKELTEQTSYVMQNQGSGAMFYNVGATPFVLPAGKCYAELPEGSQARTIVLNNDATGIESNLSTEAKAQNIYNLTGQRVSKMLPQRIYIVNGQKVVKQ